MKRHLHPNQSFSLHGRWAIMMTSRKKKSILVVCYYNDNNEKNLHHDATWEDEADTNPSHARWRQNNSTTIQRRKVGKPSFYLYYLQERHQTDTTINPFDSERGGNRT